MNQKHESKPYDLGERTLKFARDIIDLTNGVSKSLANVEIARQVIRSSGSVGANYIEANEALSKKDFGTRIKLCRKEAKETAYWLKLLQTDGASSAVTSSLIAEAGELVKIFSAIVEKSKPV